MAWNHLLCFSKSILLLFTEMMPSASSPCLWTSPPPKTKPSAAFPVRLTTLCHGIFTGSRFECRAYPTTLARRGFRASKAPVATFPPGNPFRGSGSFKQPILYYIELLYLPGVISSYFLKILINVLLSL